MCWSYCTIWEKEHVFRHTAAVHKKLFNFTRSEGKSTPQIALKTIFIVGKGSQCKLFPVQKYALKAAIKWATHIKDKGQCKAKQPQ